METAELQHKLSRKVAQLTKVIFHLNVKHEEHDAYIKAISEAYEREVECIVSDVNQKLHSCVEAFEEHRKNQISEKELEEVLEQLQGAKENMVADAQNYHRQCLEDVTKCKEEYTARARLFSEEVCEATEEARRWTSQLKQALGTLNENKEKFLDLHQNREYEKNLQEEVRRQQEHIDRLREEKCQVETDFNATKSLLDHTQIESERRCRALEVAQAKLTALENALQLSNKHNDDLKQAAKETSEKYEQMINELQLSAKSLTEALGLKNQEIEELKQTLQATERSSHAVADEKSKVEMALKESEEKITMLGDRIAERDKEIHLRGTELISEMQKRIVIYEQEIEQLKAKLVQSEAAEKKALQENKSGIEELLSLKRQRDQLEKETVPRLTEEMDRLKMDLEQMDKLKELYADVELKRVRKEEELQKVEERCRVLQHEMDETARAYHLEKAELKDTQNKALESFMLQRSQHKEEIRQMEEQISTLQRRVEDQETRLADTSKDEALAQMQSTLSQLQGDMEKTCQAKDELSFQLSLKQTEMKNILHDHEEEVQNLRVTILELKEQRKQIEIILQECQKASKREAAEAWEREQNLRKEAANMKSRMEEIDERATTLVVKVRDLKEEKEKLEKESEAKLEKVRESHFYEKQQWRRDLENLREGNAEELLRAQKTLEIAEKKHVENIEKLKRDHRSELDEVKLALHKQTQQQLSELKQKCDAQTEYRAQALKKQLEAASAAHAEERERMKSDMKQQIMAIEAQIRENAERFESTKKELLEQCEQSKKESEERKRTVENLQSEVVSLDATVKNIRTEMRSRENRYNEEVKKLNEDHAAKIDDIEGTHRQKCAAMEALHEQTLEAKKYEMEFLEQEHMKSLERAREELSNLHSKLQDRPSRDEDVNLIALLNDRLLYCESQIDYLQQKIQTYKLELLNRYSQRALWVVTQSDLPVRKII
ncbi:hypothetical protein TGME49_203900 [Toxoplasma gondii ME49]|uniref:Protein FAM184A/B N-terminal domain-containing protein n=1 Tax=Toxoplasma gondii (strain ATCC 50611 / Me49) TaxID=508771 RepID=S8F5T4_TOXGM|nr:hypothetical protein TGME49_203900 [Toxoplasma gondii ME49]EPT30077.1 hypothetical protein TGME49_203900 [Toxoplasma gondii ME49]|eukprot:XP_002367672.1 hypothetical protein TGME49_203900 [Toxoplasma gondii ME49]